MPTLSLDKAVRRQAILDWLKANIQLPPQEALDQARKQWPELKLPRIHALRHVLKAQGVKVPSAKPGGIKGRATKKVKRRRPGGMSEATKFILAQPPEMSRAEVVEAARKAGLSIDVKAVSDVRSRHKDLLADSAPAAEAPAQQLAIPETNGAALAKPTRKYTRRASAEPVVLPLGAMSADDADFMGLVLNLGYNRAAALLQQFRRQFFDQLKAHTTSEE